MAEEEKEDPREKEDRRTRAYKMFAHDPAAILFLDFYFTYIAEFEQGGDVFLGKSGLNIIAENYMPKLEDSSA